MNILLIVGLILSPMLYTQSFENYASSIIAGESVPGCIECHRLIACTILNDAQKRIDRGVSPYTLHPGRWHGFNRNFSEEHVEALQWALDTKCEGMPACKYLGNMNDYKYWLRNGGINNIQAVIVGNKVAAVVCVPWASPKPYVMTHAHRYNVDTDY